MNNLKALKTPVLLLTYKRLDTTKQVFESIRKAKPPRLYISSNIGINEEENKKVQLVRSYIQHNIDWKCDVKKLYRTEHLSVKYSISSAIDWFFENEEMGIILEDDCLPSQSFFWFCEKLLIKYKNEMRIWHISGDNFQDNIKRGDGNYYFSIYNHIWGWASWANRWKYYDVELNNINDEKFLFEIFENKKILKYWLNFFKKVKGNIINTWDAQWTFTIWLHKGISILPNQNLVSNIGFGPYSTHTKIKSKQTNIPTFEIYKINHPSRIIIDELADEYTFLTVFKPKPLLIRVVNKIRYLMNKYK